MGFFMIICFLGSIHYISPSSSSSSPLSPPPLFQILSISTVIFHISFVLNDFFCFLVNGNGIRVETLSASSKACSMASAGRGLTSLDAAKILVRDVGAMEGTW